MRNIISLGVVGALFALAACGSPEQRAQAPQQPATAPIYNSVSDCQAQSPDPGLCASAFAASQANLPKYSAKSQCEVEYGAGNCETRRDSNGSDVFGPMMMGFMLGNMLSDNNRRYEPIYRDRDGDVYSGGRSLGYRAERRTDNGRTTYVAPRSVTYSNDNKPTASVAPAPVVKRGGFGATSASYDSKQPTVKADKYTSGNTVKASSPFGAPKAANDNGAVKRSGFGSTPTPSYKAANDNRPSYKAPAYKASNDNKPSYKSSWGSSSSSSSYKSSGSSYKSSGSSYKSSGSSYKSSSSSRRR